MLRTDKHLLIFMQHTTKFVNKNKNKNIIINTREILFSKQFVLCYVVINTCKWDVYRADMTAENIRYISCLQKAVYKNLTKSAYLP